VFNRAHFFVLKELLYTDYVLFKTTFVSRFFDLCFWASINLFVGGYMLPAFGIGPSYGGFMAAGVCAAAGLNLVFATAMQIVADFEGDQLYLYYATLPIPTSFIFIRIFLNYALSTMAMGIFVLPLAKLLVWSRFDLSNFSIPLFLLAFSITNIFYGALTLWLVSRLDSMKKMRSAWMRYIYPMFGFGGFYFSWFAFYAANPKLAYLDLCNPMMHVMEIMRTAILGQPGFLNFWFSFCALALFITVFMWSGVARLKKRLDLI
jgi:ABC-type multidrug transport system permease subunit